MLTVDYEVGKVKIRPATHHVNALLFIVLLSLLVITFMYSIYIYVPETNYVLYIVLQLLCSYSLRHM
jgi:hypothetical protein